MVTNYTAVLTDPMKIVILGGFLGSGKTSVLLQLLGYLTGATAAVETKPEQIRVTVIENEIGEISVDNEVIKAEGYTVKNLFAGCVCCTMTGDLVRSIERIQKELAPEWIVVESTGVAYPKRMKEVIQTTFEMVPRIVIVADAKRWQRLLIPMENLITGQLEEADMVLINKIDLVSAEVLETVRKSIVSFNDQAEQIPVCAAMPIDAIVWEKLLGLEPVGY